MSIIFLILTVIINTSNAGLPNYSILTWETKIHNPVSGHKIPLIVHYPAGGSNERFPIMVFNHGGDTKNTWYDFVWQWVVPLGYIVVLPGDYEKYINDFHYAADQRYTLDYMYDNCNVNLTCPLYNKIMLNSSVASGHSMGGGATFFSIGDYDLGQTFTHEFNAAFTLSGCAFSIKKMEDAVKNITNKSVFIMSATHDCICPPDDNSVLFFSQINDTNTCKFLADITNGTHCNFMQPPKDIRDVPCVTEETILCPIEYHHNINATYQWSIVNKYMTLFLNATMYKNYDNFDEIVNQLRNDKAQGVMRDVDNANCPS